MSTGAKLIVTFGIIIGFFLLFGFLIAAQGGGRPGVIGLIMAFGAFAGIRAVWKKPSEDNDNHHLDKTS